MSKAVRIMMAGNQTIALEEQRPHDPDMNAPLTNQSQEHSRPEANERKRLYVLIGCAISQIPIWGFALTYGVFQEYYSSNWTLQGSRSTTGIIGTTFNGVMYLSMPFFFALFTKRWARKRRAAALGGALLTCLSFLLSSFSTNVWHLIVTQGVLAPLGCALIYSPTTLSLGEWYNTGNRAVAYGIILSCKNVVGSVCPFLLRSLLSNYSFRNTLRIWAALAAGSSILAIALIPTHPSSLSTTTSITTDTPPQDRTRTIPWSFLKHPTFHIYTIAIVLQSSGYGIPQTYLNTYAHDVALLSQSSATLLLTLFNVPGIASSAFFGYLCDNKHVPLSATTVTAISAGSSALAAFLLWGLTSQGSMALLTLFSITFGFFAGGYSASWGGVVNELEKEAARRNEAIDPGMVYGMLNGARGIGYVSGGLVGVQLLKAGLSGGVGGKWGYGTEYGPLILFTGLSTVFGGWGILWRWRRKIGPVA